jgi:LmbE family N-acetylglucosaminyl deacetylase
MFLGRVIRAVPRVSQAALGLTVRAERVLAGMAALPFADLDAIIGPGSPLILAPHPDDESLGCGGLIAEACIRGRQPTVAILTDGRMSHPNSVAFPGERLVALREEETRRAVVELGLTPERLRFLRAPDGAVPHGGAGMLALAETLARLARESRASVMLTTWEQDPHPDHLAANIVAREAARIAGLRLLRYPVWGWTLPPRNWLPRAPIVGHRLAMGQHLPAKRRAIAAHESQYTDLIADDPRGFRLPERLLSALDQPWEVFLETP